MRWYASRSEVVVIGLARCVLPVLAVSAAFGESVCDVFSRSDARTDVPGAVSVVVAADGREDVRCCGFADIATGRRMSPDTLFWIASNTKAMAAAVMLTLVDEGAVGLDDSVDRYLPEFKCLQVEDAQSPGGVRLAKACPTVRQLLSHTSGLKFFPEMPIDRWPVRLLASKAARMPQRADPGTRYCYSNWGIDVAMAVAEVVTGTTWEQLLKNRILVPLGMTDTTFFPTDAQTARLASSYRVADGQPLQAMTVDQLQYPYSLHSRYPEAGGGLFSTAHDVAAFYRMIARNGLAPDGRRILSERMVAEWAKSQTPASAGVSYSFGLKVNGSRLGHGGAYGTFAEADRATGGVRVYLTQVHGGTGNAVTKRRFADWQKATAGEERKTEGLGTPKLQ